MKNRKRNINEKIIFFRRITFDFLYVYLTVNMTFEIVSAVCKSIERTVRLKFYYSQKYQNESFCKN